LDIPARYLADIPKSERASLLRQLSERSDDKRLDYVHGWFHYYGDGEGVEASSMLYLKLLPRRNYSPLVFVHMSKPFAGKSAPALNQTFVLEWSGVDWKDVTAAVMPKGIDLSMHFRPRRANLVVETAPWVKDQRNDGRQATYSFGKRTLDLVWNGRAFQSRKSGKKSLSNDD
jgi:hypothetical protein